MHRSFWAVLAVLLLATATVPVPSQAAEEAAGTVAVPADGVVVYYFHGNVRCATCKKLEAYSEEAITGAFASELESGDLLWRAVNTDEPANAHFVQDFELLTKSLVLVEYRDGKVARWENLKLIWQLVRDHDGYVKYVRDQTRDFLAEG